MPVPSVHAHISQNSATDTATTEVEHFHGERTNLKTEAMIQSLKNAFSVSSKNLMSGTLH